MEKRRIGSLEVSVCGLGCNNFGGRLDSSQTAAVVEAALDAGINFFDTADVYGQTKSEEFLGRALRGRRSEVIIATKFGMDVDESRQGADPRYVLQAADDSLRRLNTDYIDLYQLHVPDPGVPIADTLGALRRLVDAGKVREIGCSNFSVDELRESRVAAGEGPAFASVQNEYSLLNRSAEEGVLDECLRTGVAFLPYFPLASGLLTGKYTRGEPAPEGTRLAQNWAANRLTDERLEAVERLASVAASRGRTILDLAFSWLLSRPVVASVIAGATRPEQVRSNARAIGWQLDASILGEVDSIVAPRSIVRARRQS